MTHMTHMTHMTDIISPASALSRSVLCRLCQLMPLLALLVLLAGSALAQQTKSATDGSTPLALRQGQPAGSFALSGFDNVNPYNGNLNFHLPLLQIGGRGAAQMTMMLKIDSKGWHVKHKDVEYKTRIARTVSVTPYRIQSLPVMTREPATGRACWSDAIRAPAPAHFAVITPMSSQRR